MSALRSQRPAGCSSTSRFSRGIPLRQAQPARLPSTTPRRAVLRVSAVASPTVAPKTPVRKTVSIEGVDPVLEQELRENGVRSTRRTKIVCTIGPAVESEEKLAMLAENGMNVARLNMCHGSHEWHGTVIDRIRKLNEERGYSIAVLMDTEGSEIHTMPLKEPLRVETDETYTLTVRTNVEEPGVISVSYDAFIDDVEVGDVVIVDGGMTSFVVMSKAGPDVVCRCVVPGLILSRANLTFRNPDGAIVRGRNSMLPVISAKDWNDIDFAISKQVDFIAVSFVKTSDVINNLKSYIEMRSPERRIEIMAKIESYDSVPNMTSIIDASDAIMVARGDLGAQIPYEDVPSVQKEIVYRCRQHGKPVIVASQLLNSMMENPIPTRAEVADVADVCRQGADALMLSGETAVGAYAEKVMLVTKDVCREVEQWCREETYGGVAPAETTQGHKDSGHLSQELCQAAAVCADKLGASAICVFTRRGQMANLLSRARPACPIMAFTDTEDVRRRLNLRWGVMPFRVDFEDNPEMNISRTFALLKTREMVSEGDLVVVVSDIRVKGEAGVRSVQLRYVA